MKTIVKMLMLYVFVEMMTMFLVIGVDMMQEYRCFMMKAVEDNRQSSPKQMMQCLDYDIYLSNIKFR